MSTGNGVWSLSSGHMPAIKPWKLNTRTTRKRGTQLEYSHCGQWMPAYLNIVLHVQVIYDEWLSELCVLNRLFQWEAFRMEWHQTITDWPIFNGILFGQTSEMHFRYFLIIRPMDNVHTFRITSSSNTTIRMYSNSCNRVKISVIGLDWAFLAIAQIPTNTCLPEFDEALQSESMPSFESPPHKSMSPCQLKLKTFITIEMAVILRIVNVKRLSKRKSFVNSLEWS